MGEPITELSHPINLKTYGKKEQAYSEVWVVIVLYELLLRI